jgi:hypothetical protein
MSFLQQSIDAGSDRAALRIENITGRTLRVREVGLDWPGYGRFTSPARHVVGAGQALDLPLRLPRERCAADPPSVRASGIAVTADGRTIRRPIDDMGMRFLERLLRTGCGERRVRRALDLSYGAPWRTAGSGGEAVLETSLVLRRRHGREVVELVGVRGSVLFDLVPGDLRVMDAEQRRARLPIAIDPGRCDQHARSQASQPFTFRVFLRLADDDEPIGVVLEPSRRQQVDLLAFLDEACASAE